MNFLNNNYNIFILKFVFINYAFLLGIYKSEKYNENNNNPSNILNKKDYSNKKFIIIKDKCFICGLFAFYKLGLGCINKYLIQGYIPIIDIKCFPNIINGFNTSINKWELLFEQPFGYKLDEVLKYGKNIKNITDIWHECGMGLELKALPFEEPKRIYWHNLANKYLPIKKEIIDLSNKLIHILFKNSKNILGVLTRGTDYISMKPKNHPIPPKLKDLINDVKYMDDKYKYDYIFFSSEDKSIREKFSKHFPNKIKQIEFKSKINYNYTNKNFLGLNKNIQGNIEYNKIYLLNIIILSKCLDLITAKCNGAIGIFILSNGFRNEKIYNLGVY